MIRGLDLPGLLTSNANNLRPLACQPLQKLNSSCSATEKCNRRSASCYNSRMTLMTVTYELQEPLKPAQFKALGDFANTYGLQNFWLDEKTGYLHLDYDASRLKEIVVEQVLRDARIPVLRKLEPRNN